MKRGTANLYAIITAFLIMLCSSMLLTSYSIIKNTMASFNLEESTKFKFNNFNRCLENSVKNLFMNKSDFNIQLSDLNEINKKMPNFLLKELKSDGMKYSISYYDDLGSFSKKLSEKELYFKIQYCLYGKNIKLENFTKVWVRKDIKKNSISVEVENLN